MHQLRVNHASETRVNRRSRASGTVLHRCLHSFLFIVRGKYRLLTLLGRLSVRPMHPLGWSSFSGCIGRCGCNRQRRAPFQSLFTLLLSLLMPMTWAYPTLLTHYLPLLLSPNFAAPIFSICLAHSQGQQQYKKLQQHAGIVSPALQEQSERRGDMCTDISLRLPPQARPPTLLDAESSAETHPTTCLIDIRLRLAHPGCSECKTARRRIE